MDEETGLELLVAQRKTRPAFARMISWEIDNSGGASWKQQRKVSVMDEEDERGNDSVDEQSGDNSDSDESEYFSAGEEVKSLSDESCDLSSSCSSFNQQPGERNISSTNETDCNIDGQEMKSVNFDKTRSLSKKQKKKRRDKMKQNIYTLYAEYDVPFRNVEDIDIEVSDLVGFTSESSEPCLRNVPSLFELCLYSISNKKHNKPRYSVSELPVMMKKMLSKTRLDQSFTSMQLSWLYRMMAYGQEFMTQFVEKDRDDHEIVKFTCRNIWNFFFYNSSDTYIGGQLSSFLLYSYFGHPLEHYRLYRWRHKAGLLAVVAAVLDLMLPRQLSSGRLRHASRDCSTESELISKTTDSLVYSVKEILKKRYPDVVKHFFDLAVPYAFWARGNVRFAAESFVRLAQTKEGGIERAMLLGEAARMYAQNQQCEKASRLYMEASGCLINMAIVRNQEDEVKLQQFMLMASVFDQGMMTEEKAKKAADSWTAAMKCFDPKSPWIAVMRAVESFLCFHSGSSRESVKDRLLAAVCLLEKLCVHSELLFLHLSFVKVLLGDVSGADKAYRIFTQSAHAMSIEVGPLPTSGNFRRSNPWRSLQAHFQQYGTPDLLKVIWRTQLGHPRVVGSSDVYEGDLRAKDLVLELNDAGNLTADIQMLLPPIRALNLDPYTGQNIPSSGGTNFWHAYENLGVIAYETPSGSFQVVPTMTELYRDECGNTVHILSPESSLIDERHRFCPQITVFWTGAGGQKAKLNLIPLLQDAKKEFVFVKILQEQKRINPNGNIKAGLRGSDSWVEEMNMAVTCCHKKGYAIGFSSSERVKQNMMPFVLKCVQNEGRKTKSSLSKSEKKKEAKISEKKKKLDFERWKHCLPPPAGYHLEEYHAYKDTLFMAFRDNSTDIRRVYVFIDCTNKENFLNPVVTTEFTHESNSKSSLQQQGKSESSYHQEKDELFWHAGTDLKTSCQCFVVYGRKGECLKNVSIEEGMKHPHVKGNKLYGIIEEKQVSCHNLKDDVITSVELPGISSLHFGGGKVITVTSSDIYFLQPNDLSVVPLKLQTESSSVELSKDGCSIKIIAETIVKILEEKTRGDQIRLALGVNMVLLFIDITMDSIEIVQTVHLSGLPSEVYTVSEQVGFLVTTTVNKELYQFYRENLFYYRYDGRILGVLPLLGPGPRCFCVKYLSGSEEQTKSGVGASSWYVYMRDGHEGLMGIRLP